MLMRTFFGKICCSIFLIIGGWTVCYAQSSSSPAQKIYQKALLALDEQKTNDCIILLQEAIQKDPQFIDPLLTLFQVYLDNKKYTLAIPLFDQAKNIDSIATAPYFIKQAMAYASMGDYTKAKNITELYLADEKINASISAKAKITLDACNFALSHPSSPDITIQNAGDSVNTAAAEYFPYFSSKDSVLYFMRKKNIRREDFYTSRLLPNGFTKAILLADSINDADKKGSVSFLPDMQTLYFAADYPEQGYGRYDIYKSIFQNHKWSAPKNLGYQINTDYWDSAPSISPDGKALYFASNRPGGYGGIDLYVAYKNDQGVWEEASNLGDQINTEGDEQTPFIHADNQTLYFSSTGWPGFGGADFYVSRKKIDGTWSQPINLGSPINTFDNEGSIAVANNGKDAYIASDRSDSRGGLDIYKITLSKETQGNTKWFLTGQIQDAKSKKTISSDIEILDATDNTSIFKLGTDTTGRLVLALPLIDSIAISIRSPFYEKRIVKIFNSDFNNNHTANKIFELQPIQNNFTQTFQNVLFKSESDQLLAGSEKELNELVAYLVQQPKATITIEGHTDNTGLAEKNKTLSLKRANAIAQYLIKQHISAHRITTFGYGDTKPITSNETEKGRQQNRRTSFTIHL
jgi:outer membrane protein OmpA-like peptidoglycan-associated protein